MFAPGDQVRSRSEILFVGRLVSGKGADILLGAMPHILARHPGASLTLVGDGPEKVSLADTAQRSGIAGRVRFAGALPHAELPQHYRRAALLVLPSREEGFGLVLVEALGCGCPVAASDLPAVRALLGDGTGGRLFRPEDPEDLARVVAELLADEAERQAIAERGRADVLGRYGWDAIAQRYSRVLADGPVSKRESHGTHRQP
jgi:glycosyltransferase involved in cell wall biosynthesis